MVPARVWRTHLRVDLDMFCGPPIRSGDPMTLTLRPCPNVECAPIRYAEFIAIRFSRTTSRTFEVRAFAPRRHLSKAPACAMRLQKVTITVMYLARVAIPDRTLEISERPRCIP